MIIESLLNLFYKLFELVFGWINIPGVGEEFDDALAFFDDLLNAGKSLIDLFLPWDIVRFGLPIIIILLNFEHIYHFIMWIVKKIPMLGIK